MGQGEVVRAQGLAEDVHERGQQDRAHGQDDENGGQHRGPGERQRLEAPERYRQHAHALPAHQRVPAPAEQPVAGRHGDDGEHHQDNREGGRLAHPRGGAHVDVGHDLSGEDIDPARHADHGRDAEGGGRRGEHEQPAREEARGHERERDVPEHAHRARAADPRRLLERVVHLLQGRGDVEEGQRVVEERHHPDQARQAVDVERPGGGETEAADQDDVEVPHAGGEQQDPGDRADVRRDHVRHEKDRPEPAPPGQVAAHHEPGQAGGKRHGEEHGEPADHDRHDDRIPVAALGVNGEVVLQAEVPARPEEALPDENHQRHQHKEEEE